MTLSSIKSVISRLIDWRLLDEERQVWLKQAITVYHPRHHWLTELDAS
ncbi:hypothetical protein [Nostoc sp.]